MRECNPVSTIAPMAGNQIGRSMPVEVARAGDCPGIRRPHVRSGSDRQLPKVVPGWRGDRSGDEAHKSRNSNGPPGRADGRRTCRRPGVVQAGRPIGAGKAGPSTRTRKAGTPGSGNQRSPDERRNVDRLRRPKTAATFLARTVGVSDHPHRWKQYDMETGTPCFPVGPGGGCYRRATHGSVSWLASRQETKGTPFR